MTNNSYLLLLLFSIFAWSAKAQITQKVDSTSLNHYFNPMKWRSIGPFRGGRSGAVCGTPDDMLTYYMGTTGGGVWKTDDIGITWRNISDGYFTTGSVGAVAVAESNANVLYVGMGEHAVRGVMTHHGDGMYKSIDAGKTWSKIGLAGSQHIARIVIHPTDPNTVWVAAQGALYSASKERGIYKTTNGGLTWSCVLYVNDKTGCAELSIDRHNPNVLYAAMWEHGRLPWQVMSGGAGSGLYKSVDGGANWERLTEGLPTEMGKMAIAVCPSNSEKVYALIESDSEKEAGGLFVSNDGGASWSLVNNDHRLVQRAWYYIELFVDPKDEHKIYVLSAPALRSIDGGKSWSGFASSTHGDYHDMWINPSQPECMVVGDDGGAFITLNDGISWSTNLNMPTGQFYRINVDNQFPYKIYAGQQDYGSIYIHSRMLGEGSIDAKAWGYAAGGESAFVAFDPNNPRYLLGGSYQGTIDVLDTKSNASTNIMAAPIQYLGRDAKDMKYRFNWNAPIIWSKHEANTYYHASQMLLKTNDLGMTWKEASPDLTRNEKSKQGKPGVPYTNEAVGAENYGTISYVVESPAEKGVIWVGSDDGLVHLTTDGGKNWKNVTPSGLHECLINAIEVSPHDKATAYIATTRYKFNDHTPAIYKTMNYGQTWVRITNGIAPNAFTRVVREDDVRRDMLFAGTELGLYLSWNGGNSWEPCQLNLPIAPITDLRVHQGDLIASTSGRAFWILDDLELLRQHKDKKAEFSIFKPENAYIANGKSSLDHTDDKFTGAYSHEGVNPANGIVLYYRLPELKKEDILTLEVRDATGNLVRAYSSKKDSLFTEWDGGPAAEPVLSTHKGLNRFVWNMRYPTLTGIKDTYFENSFKGHKAAPGTYTFVLKNGSQQVSTSADILPNPLYSISATTYQAYHSLMLDMEQKLEIMHLTIIKIDNKRKQLEEVLNNLLRIEKHKAILGDGNTLVEKMKIWDKEMVQRKSKAYDDVENFPNMFTADYLFMINQTESDIPQVNQSSIELKKEMDAKWAGLQMRAQEILEKDIPNINKLLWDSGVGVIWKE